MPMIAMCRTLERTGEIISFLANYLKAARVTPINTRRRNHELWWMHHVKNVLLGEKEAITVFIIWHKRSPDEYVLSQ